MYPNTCLGISSHSLDFFVWTSVNSANSSSRRASRLMVQEQCVSIAGCNLHYTLSLVSHKLNTYLSVPHDMRCLRDYCHTTKNVSNYQTDFAYQSYLCVSYCCQYEKTLFTNVWCSVLLRHTCFLHKY